jgi:hypothetical protein
VAQLLLGPPKTLTSRSRLDFDEAVGAGDAKLTPRSEAASTPRFPPTYAADSHEGHLYMTNGSEPEINVLGGSNNTLYVIENRGLDLPYGIVCNCVVDFYVINIGSDTITDIVGTANSSTPFDNVRILYRRLEPSCPQSAAASRSPSRKRA